MLFEKKICLHSLYYIFNKNICLELYFSERENLELEEKERQDKKKKIAKNSNTALAAPQAKSSQKRKSEVMTTEKNVKKRKK